MTRIFAIFALAAALLSGNPVSAAPNVIFIMVDDLGYGDIYNTYQHTRDNGAGGGIAGDGIRNGTEEPFIYTPNIDRMAAEGAKLTRHYTAAPVCAPARGSLLQGRDQGHANIRDNSFDKIIADNHTLGTVMKKAGYYTAVVGKWGVGGTSPTAAGRPNNRGFDYFYGYIRHLNGHHHYSNNNGTVVEQTTPITTGLDHAYSADLWTAKAKQIIIDRAQNHAAQPFFLYLAYETPHAQLQVPTQAYPAGSGLTGGIQWPLNTNSGTNDSYIHPDYAGLTNAAAKRHATMVRRLDNCVGDILQTLRDLDIDDNTLVVFTSDNGPHNEKGQGGTYTQDPRFFKSYANMEGIKRDDWEAGIREPTFAWWPGHIGDNNAATPGLNSTRPSAFWDWMPTLAEAAGLTPPAWSSGVSLLPELTGTGTQQDKGYLYSEYNVSSNTPTYTDFPNHGGARRNQMQYIFLKHTDGKIYKGVRYNIASAATDFKIFDVDIDPGEANDLAPSMSTLQQAMKDKVLQVRIDGDYSRPYSSANVPAVTLPATTNGLEYKAFEGSWDWVPETAYLTPAATGTAANFDLSKRTRDGDIALEFKGYIRIAQAGSYTFRMTTDSSVTTSTSGAMLWIHDANIIDDDYNHNGSEKSGTVRLAVGYHPIRVIYKHAGGTHDFALKYSGPGIALQPVPDSALFLEGTAPSGPPEASDDHATTTGSTTGPGASILVDVLFNDIDDGTPDPLSISAVSPPRAGTAAVESGKIRYTPRQGFFGTDSFEYTVTDGQDSDTATVTVDVAVAGTDYWYPFDETSGYVATEAGGGKPATLTNYSADPAQWVTGKFGNALSFDNAAHQFVSIDGFKGILGTGDRTVCAWIKTTGTGLHPVIAWGPNATGQKWTFLVQNGHVRLEVTAGYREGKTLVNNGAWHHVACTWANDGTPDAADIKLYIDGVLETQFAATKNQTINTTATIDALIGSDSQSRYFAGVIDDARIYARALSASEIADLAAQTGADNDATLWFYQNLGNAAPTSADWDADPDGDGYSNFAEYALGGSPHWFEASMLPVLQPSSSTDTFDYLYNRRIALGASAYTVESSPDMLAWSPMPGGTAAPHPDLPGFQRVTVPLPDDGTPRRFVRLKIE